MSADLATRAVRTLQPMAAGLIGAGIVVSLWIALHVPEGIFFTADSGMKWIMMLQFAHGDWSIAVTPPTDPWLAHQWQLGRVPFTPPFVYPINGQYVQCFPVFFSVLTAPFWRLMGWNGIYAIPLLSGWLTWIVFWLVAERFKLSRFATLASLAILIFGTPLTYYATTFWEHTLAVVLSFAGWWLICEDERTGRRRGIAACATGGALMCLAGYFRPEHFVLMAAIGAAWIPINRAQFKQWIPFAAGCTLAMIAFVAFNLALYARPLGAHSFSTLDPMPFVEHLKRQSLPALPVMVRDLVNFVPLTVAAVIGCGVLISVRRISITSLRLLIALLIFVLGVPVIVSHAGALRLGPRYYLGVIPFVCILAARLIDEIRVANIWKPQLNRVALTTLFAATAFWAMWLNVSALVDYRSTYIQYDDVRTFLKGRPERVVVILDHSLVLEMATLIGEKDFVLYRDIDDLNALSRDIAASGQKNWIVVVHHQPGQETPEHVTGGAPDAKYNGDRIAAMPTYDFYRITLMK